MKKIAFLLLLPFFAAAQTGIPAKLQQYMRAQAAVKGFSGSVLVMQHNKALLSAGFGYANYEWKIPNTAETKFRIGSVTKQFTAACILQLEEEGKLSTSDLLSKYIPDYPKGDSVTIHMLLNHTSGIANYTDLPGFINVARLSWSKDSIIHFFKNKPYNFSPGTKWSYTNSGFFLLGYIVEKLSGQTYSSYVRQHILDKLLMANTGTDQLDSLLPQRASGYNLSKNKTTNADFISMEWPFSAGVLYATTGDLYKWDRALYGISVLSAASKQKMFTPGLSNYGYGIIIDSFEQHPRIWHNGGIPGFAANISRYIKDDLCIIVLSNNSANSDAVADALADIVFNIPVEVPYIHKEVPINSSILDRYVGKYKAFLTVEVIKRDGKLFRHRADTPDIELKPESNTKFFYADDSDRQLEFEVDKAGHVTKIWFINNEQKGEMKRVE